LIIENRKRLSIKAFITKNDPLPFVRADAAHYNFRKILKNKKKFGVRFWKIHSPQWITSNHPWLRTSFMENP